MEDVQKVMDKLSKANKLMEDLIDLAMEDEQLSDDERDMLFSINNNLGSYAKQIIETISDGEVEISEMDNIKHIEEKIVKDANEIAEADNNISDEEKTILNQLVEVIENM